MEVTDALAEYWHAWMRKEMGFADPTLTPQDYVVQKYRGSRYGFGYPACPDLSMNKTVLRPGPCGSDRRVGDGELHAGSRSQHVGADRASSEGEVFQRLK